MLYQLADLTVNTETQEVLRGKNPLDVHGLNFRLFAFLLNQGTQVCSFDELVAGVWHPNQVNNETVTQRIRLLRVALGDTDKQPKYIRTVRGQGYQLCTAPANAEGQREPQSLAGWSMAALIAAIVLIGAALLWDPETQVEVAEKTPYQQKLSRAEYYAHIGQKDDVQRALTILASVQEQGVSDPRWLVNKSFALSIGVCRFGASFEDAKQSAQLAMSAIALAPDKPQPYQAMAFANDCMGHSQKAIDWYRKAVALDPQLQTGSLSSLAYLLSETGELAEALRINRRLLVEKPSESYTQLQLGHTYGLLEYAPLAEHFLTASFELYPDNVFSNLALPRFLWLEGRSDEAGRAFDEALNRPQHADLWLLKADMHLLAEERQLASQALEKASSLKPEASIYRSLQLVLRGEFDLLPARLAQLPPAQASAGVLPMLERALLLAATQQPDAAAQALEAAVNAGFLDGRFLQRSALLAPLRSLPGFTALLAKIHSKIAAQRAKVPAAATEIPTVDS